MPFMQVKAESFLCRLLIVTARIISYASKQDLLVAGQSVVGNLANSLADYILTSKLKLLYTLLASERQRANAALHLLATIAEQSPSFVEELCRRFDFELPVLYKLARAPR